MQGDFHPDNRLQGSELRRVRCPQPAEYNERTVVERCISQVLTAPLPDNMDLELVIVDDCSTDGTFAILERVATAFSQIRFTVRSEIAAREQQSATRLSMLRAIFHSSRTPTWNTTPPITHSCCGPC